MYKTLTAIAVTALMTTTACAQSTHVVDARVTSVAPQISTVYDAIPYQECELVQVPVYETRRSGGASAGDVLGGMIIGGILGKGITGNDNGAGVGAVIGGMVSADRGQREYQVVTGYRNERQCHTEYRPTERQVLNGYLVKYDWNGLNGDLITDTKYEVGDTIVVSVTLN